MTDPRTSGAMSAQAENELICEKLLGWKKSPYTRIAVCWDRGDGEITATPTFITWADAGLILDRMSARGHMPRIGEKYAHGAWYAVTYVGDAVNAPTGPLAVRAAALQWIKAVTS